jgi:hypothetical protein
MYGGGKMLGGGFNDPFQTRLMDGYMGGGATTVEGRATLDVNVNAPRGTTVDTSASGLFRDVNTSRSVQMPTASSGDVENVPPI